jgi:hypothetical protein
MTRRAKCLIVAGITLASTLIRPASVSASCVAPGSLPSLTTAVASAPLMFVGTVTALDNRARVATVHVDVWRGQGIAAVVVVVGSPRSRSGRDLR